MLKIYIYFAKTTCNPKLDNIDRDKIAEFYSDLRQKSMSSPDDIYKKCYIFNGRICNVCI